MEATHVDRPVTGLARATGRRTALHSVVASGMAMLAALGLGDVTAKGPHKGGRDAPVQDDGKRSKQRKTKRGPAGPAGPTGSAGPTGPAGSIEFTTRVKTTEESDPLGSSATDTQGAFADCGGEGKAVSCGYQMGGAVAEWASVFVETVGPDGRRTGCGVSLRRTVDVSSTSGVTIRAIAVCLV